MVSPEQGAVTVGPSHLPRDGQPRTGGGHSGPFPSAPRWSAQGRGRSQRALPVCPAGVSPGQGAVMVGSSRLHPGWPATSSPTTRCLIHRIIQQKNPSENAAVTRPLDWHAPPLSFPPLTIWAGRPWEPGGTAEPWLPISPRGAGVQRGETRFSCEAFGSHFARQASLLI